MKKNAIVKGGKYTDNKGAVREVLAVGPEYIAYGGQVGTDNLQYKLLAKKQGPHMVGSIRNSTRISFASWAKAKVN